MLGLRVRIPLGAWVFVMIVVCCVGWGPCDGLITRSEDLYRLWVCVNARACVHVRHILCLNTSAMRTPKPVSPQTKKGIKYTKYELWHLFGRVLLCLRNYDSIIYTVRSFSLLLSCFSHTCTPRFKVYSPYSLWQLFKRKHKELQDSCIFHCRIMQFISKH